MHFVLIAGKRFTWAHLASLSSSCEGIKGCELSGSNTPVAVGISVSIDDNIAWNRAHDIDLKQKKFAAEPCCSTPKLQKLRRNVLFSTS